MIIDELRKQINNCDESRYQIAKDTGVDAAALCRIMHGGSCKVETADTLLEYFGLKLAPRQKRRKNA